MSPVAYGMDSARHRIARGVWSGAYARGAFFEKVLYVHRTRNRLITPVSITKMIIASM